MALQGQVPYRGELAGGLTSCRKAGESKSRLVCSMLERSSAGSEYRIKVIDFKYRRLLWADLATSTIRSRPCPTWIKQKLSRRLFIKIQRSVLLILGTFLGVMHLTPIQDVVHSKKITVPFETIKELPPTSFAIAEKAVIKSEPQPASSGGDIETIVRHAARKYGLDESYFLHIARCESSLNPNEVNHEYFENGNPSGLFQHISGYWSARAAKYGYEGRSVFDAEANANVTAAMFKDGLQGLWECK